MCFFYLQKLQVSNLGNNWLKRTLDLCEMRSSYISLEDVHPSSQIFTDIIHYAGTSQSTGPQKVASFIQLVCMTGTGSAYLTSQNLSEDHFYFGPCCSKTSNLMFLVIRWRINLLLYLIEFNGIFGKIGEIVDLERIQMWLFHLPKVLLLHLHEAEHLCFVIKTLLTHDKI